MARPRPLATVAAILAIALLSGYAVLWIGVSRDNIATSDFTAAYLGGLSLREGHRADLYDERREAPVHAALVAPARTADLPYINPPAAALLMAPLSLMPLQVAYRVFQALQLLCLGAAVVIAARAAPWSAAARRARAPVVTALIALAGAGTMALGLLAQWDGMAAVGLAAAYVLWRRDRRLLGGAVLAASATLAKPHLAVGLAAMLLGWRDRRVLTGAALALALVALTSLLEVGVAGIAGFAAAVAADAGRWPLTIMLGFNGLTGSWLGNGLPAQGVALAASVTAVGICFWLGRRVRHGAALEPCLAAATALSLLASPHMLTHDLVLLAPVLVAVIAWASRVDRQPGWPGRRATAAVTGWMGLSVAALLDLSAQHGAPPGRLVPLVLATGAAALLWQLRRGDAGPSPQPGAAPSLAPA